MLIRFIVENFLSFKEQQVFFMTAGKHTRHSSHVATLAGKRILKGSFIFGANASGKSNFVKAVAMLQLIVFSGLDKTIINRKYFRIDSSYRNKPGLLQLDFFSNGSFYSYGMAFSYVNCGIISEWLYKIEENKEICVFNRTVENGKSTITTDLKLEQDNKYRLRIYGEDLPQNKTFLKEIAEKEIAKDSEFKAFFDVWMWFQNLIIITPDTHILQNSILSFGIEKQTDALLRYFDTGIQSIKVENEPLDKVLEFLPFNSRADVYRTIRNAVVHSQSYYFNIAGNFYLFRLSNGEIVASRLFMDHGNSSELFSFEDESDGTQRLFDLLPFLAGIKGDGVILIDELDRSFHTNLIIKFVELFYEKLQRQNFQLIATLHDVNLMNFDILRQDEIWFIYRNEESAASNMYSLNKFQIRFDKRIIKDYLVGRFGSIPCFGQLDE